MFAKWNSVNNACTCISRGGLRNKYTQVTSNVACKATIWASLKSVMNCWGFQSGFHPTICVGYSAICIPVLAFITQKNSFSIQISNICEVVTEKKSRILYCHASVRHMWHPYHYHHVVLPLTVVGKHSKGIVVVCVASVTHRHRHGEYPCNDYVFDDCTYGDL